MIKIQNIYYMLAYAFRILKESGYAEVASESFPNATELYAAILIKGISNQIKRGLGREYLYNSDVLSTPKGKINISESIKNQTLISCRLSCDFDELTENVKINQILKSTAKLLLKSEEVSTERKKDLKKLLVYFSTVEDINLSKIDWDLIQYHRNNATYKMLINICYLVVNGLLISESYGNIKIRKYFDDQKLHSLYEHFVLEYYRKHFPKLRATASHIKWNTDDGLIQYLPIMRTDITLEHEGKYLIIDTKYYQQSMQKQQIYNNQTVYSNNIYQIFTYVKNRDINSDGSVSGMLLYAKTDESITPNYRYIMSGNTIWVKTLDLNQKFTNICKQLDDIVYEWIGLNNLKIE